MLLSGQYGWPAGDKPWPESGTCRRVLVSIGFTSVITIESRLVQHQLVAARRPTDTDLVIGLVGLGTMMPGGAQGPKLTRVRRSAALRPRDLAPCLHF